MGPGATVEICPAGSTPPDRRRSTEPARQHRPASPLGNPRLTFDHFVIGACNRLAHAAALAVAECPAQAYNPLFLYGPPGFGKTHLLSAIANYLRAQPRPQRPLHDGRVVHQRVPRRARHEDRPTPSRPLPRHRRAADRRRPVPRGQVHTPRRSSSTPSTPSTTRQAARPHLRPPAADLRPWRTGCASASRQASSPTCNRPISPHAWPSCASARRRRHPIARQRRPGDVAAHVHTNVRALEGALIRIVAFSSLTGRALTSDLAREVLDGLYPARPRPGKPERTVSDIQQATCQLFDISPEELLSTARSPRVALPRQLAMYLSRELTEESLPAIGRHFGGRDHTTVLHAHRRTTQRLDEDNDVREAVQQLCTALGLPADATSAQPTDRQA